MEKTSRGNRKSIGKKKYEEEKEMRLDKAIKTLDSDLQAYFKMKFPNDVKSKGKIYINEEEFLRARKHKTMLPFQQFEQSPEYAALVSLVLQQRAVKDLIAIYEKVSEQAKQGDEKAIKLFLASFKKKLTIMQN